jgi:hypothetical protein
MKKFTAILFAILIVFCFTACRQVAEDTKDIAEEATENITGNNTDNNNNGEKTSEVTIGTYRLATGNMDKTVFIPTITVKNNSDNGIDLATYFTVEAYQNSTLLVEANTDVVDERFDQKNQSKPIALGESYDYEWAWYLNDMSDVTIKVTENSNNNVTEKTLQIKEQ